MSSKIKHLVLVVHAVCYKCQESNMCNGHLMHLTFLIISKMYMFTFRYSVTFFFEKF